MGANVQKDVKPPQESIPRKEEKARQEQVNNAVKNKPRVEAKRIKLSQKNNESKESKILKVINQTNDKLDNIDLINKALEHQFFTRSLDKATRVEIIKQMSLCSIQKDAIIFKQGTIGSYFYIIKEGAVEIFINEKPIKKLSVGESFGELALLHEAPRTATVRAIKDTVVYCMERKNFRKIINKINESNFEENKKFIESVSLLANLDNDQKTILISNLIKEVYDKNTYVFKEGEPGSCLYIIKEGEVDCTQQGKLIRTLQKGDCFGERCLLVDSVRTLSIVTKTTCIIYSVSLETLRTMVGDAYRDILLKNFIKASFARSKFLKNLNPRMLDKVFEKFKFLNFDKHRTVLHKGYHLNAKIIVIIEGSIVNASTKEFYGTRGDLLFEKELISNTTELLTADLIAEPDCLVAEVDYNTFVQSLGEDIQKVIDKSLILDQIKKIPLFKTLSDIKLNNITNNIKIEKFENNDYIIKQGEYSSKFYIIKIGKVDIIQNNQYVRTLNANEYFGERALLNSEPRSTSAISNGHVETYTLDKTTFESIIETGMKNYLLERLNLQAKVELEDLDYIKPLGAGNYGAVALVKSKKTKYYYAMKSISRLKVDVEELHSYLDLEKSILLQIDHPFIVKLVSTLGDAKNIYFVMEFVKGSELFDVIREIGLLNKYQTQFYGCSMMLACQYLHERKFIHRDIKPENIMVCESGYIKLIDFGTAKKIVDRTSTINGTPHYMAPEVILGEGYTFSIDFWSIAICLYEFFCGNLPFGDDAEDPMDVYVAIVKSELNFPKFIKDKEFIHLMKLMLNKNIMARLFKLPLIKKHVWFSKFDWDKLENLDSQIPFHAKKKNYGSDELSVPFADYIKNLPDWVPDKKTKVDKSKFEQYANWHKNF